MVTQINSIIKNLLQLLHNFLKRPCILPQEVTLQNNINTMDFQHNFDSGSKFEILKPNSSWLTFGISKFVSLSISHFLFLFLQLFFTWCYHLPLSAYFISKLYQTQHHIKLNIDTNHLI